MRRRVWNSDLNESREVRGAANASARMHRECTHRRVRAANWFRIKPTDRLIAFSLSRRYDSAMNVNLPTNRRNKLISTGPQQIAITRTE